jgi:hypothetical protein
MTTYYHDQLFAPLDVDLHLQRIAGGNETEVYCSDDHSHVVKVKCADAGPGAVALAIARVRRDAAHAFAAAIGDDHSIPTYFILAANSAGEIQPVAIQPYIRHATPLFSLEYSALSASERQQLARQLAGIIARNIRTLLTHGWMPDLYGRANANIAERKRTNTWRMLPWRMWSFLVQRNLLRSHNLLVTAAPERRILLVDYDPVPRSKLYRLIYYTIRLLLFGRDLVLIHLMQAGWNPPRL